MKCLLLSNILLVHRQRPFSTMLMSFEKWQEQGRNVTRGQKGIQIITPAPYTIEVQRDRLDPRTHAPVLDSSGKPEVTFDIYNDEDASAMTYATLYEDENKLLLNWLTAVDQVQGDVVFATVKFKVADDAEEGAFLPITAEIDPDDVYDIDINNTEFNLIDGGVRVIAESEESTTEEDPGFLKGDCNDDGLVDNKDVVALFRYASAGTHVEDERKYDFNEDSEVNNKDVVELFRFVSKL